MTSNYHFGDEVTQHGDHNIGMIKNQGVADPQTAFREMINAVQVLRGQVSAADRHAIDESMRTIGTGENVEKGTLRRALGNIAGIAALVGQVGSPRDRVNPQGDGSLRHVACSGRRSLDVVAEQDDSGLVCPASVQASSSVRAGEPAIWATTSWLRARISASAWRACAAKHSSPMGERMARAQ